MFQSLDLYYSFQYFGGDSLSYLASPAKILQTSVLEVTACAASHPSTQTQQRKLQFCYLLYFMILFWFVFVIFGCTIGVRVFFHPRLPYLYAPCCTEHFHDKRISLE